MKKVVSVLLAMVMVLTLFSGCGSEDKKEVSEAPETVADGQDETKETEPAEEPEETEGGVYGVSVPNVTSSPFYNACVTGVEEGIAEFDPTATMVLQDAGGDSQKQLDQIEDLIQQGVKALIIIPIDSVSIATAIQSAKEADIPVFLMDTSAEDDTDVVSTVISNNYSAGQIAAEALVEKMGSSGKIITMHTTGSQVILDRLQALDDVLADYPDIEIVQDQIVNNGTIEESVTLMENTLQSIPDLAGVFTTGDTFAIGIASALEANGYEPGEVTVVSVDGTKEGCELVEQGWVYCTAAQLAKQMGVQSVESAVKYFNGEEVEKFIELDCVRVTADELDTYEAY